MLASPDLEENKKKRKRKKEEEKKHNPPHPKKNFRRQLHHQRAGSFMTTGAVLGYLLWDCCVTQVVQLVSTCMHTYTQRLKLTSFHRQLMIPSVFISVLLSTPGWCVLWNQVISKGYFGQLSKGTQMLDTTGMLCDQYDSQYCNKLSFIYLHDFSPYSRIVTVKFPQREEGALTSHPWFKESLCTLLSAAVSSWLKFEGKVVLPLQFG